MTNVRIKGAPRGQSRLPGCHVDCWAAQVTITLTVSQKVDQNTFLHSVQEKLHEIFSDFNHDD